MSATDLTPLSSAESEQVLRDIYADGLQLEEVLDFAGNDYIESDEGQRVIVLAHLAAGQETDVPSGLEEAEVATLRSPEIKRQLHELLDVVLYDTRSELRQERKAQGMVDEWIELNRWPQQD